MKVSSKVANISPSLTLAISAKAKAMKAEGQDVITFGVGEPDFNTPSNINQAAKDAIDKGYTKYTPSSGLPRLRQDICKKFKEENGLDYAPSQIIVSSGAKHSIFNALFAILEDGDEVIIPSPYWLTYPEVVKVCGAKPVYITATKEAGYKITPKQLEKAITEKTKCLIFNSPSNPTGAVYTEEEIRALAKVLEDKEIYVLSDEIYEKLIYGDIKHFSMAAIPEMKDKVIVINGVSKSFAMTGWRLGYLAAPLPVAKAIDSFQSHSASNTCSITQYATIEALEGDKSEPNRMVEEFKRRRDKMVQLIEEMDGVSSTHPDGAFYVMLDVSSSFGKKCGDTLITDDISFANALLDSKKVAVVPGVSFGEPRCVRLSYALGMDDLVEGMNRIGEFMKELN